MWERALRTVSEPPLESQKQSGDRKQRGPIGGPKGRPKRPQEGPIGGPKGRPKQTQEGPIGGPKGRPIGGPIGRLPGGWARQGLSKFRPLLGEDLSGHLSVHLSGHLSVHLSVPPAAVLGDLSVHLSVPPAAVSGDLSVHLSVPPAAVSGDLSVHLSVPLRLFSPDVDAPLKRRRSGPRPLSAPLIGSLCFRSPGCFWDSRGGSETVGILDTAPLALTRAVHFANFQKKKNQIIVNTRGGIGPHTALGPAPG